ncbi:amino acid permease [Patescibacteria group bacterium]|nr:amino acid permease [Patescibacteria group bacterium]MBU1703640.1 amino acid permease [Patescibacteria group bacterium]MBU1954213.1 amino acid permease [Patescibacteria group bacterium]
MDGLKNVPEVYKLKRELSLFDVTVAGVGIILGAGIYALIGIAAGEAGSATWLSFVFGAVVATFTGFSYAELSSFFKGDSGEFDYYKAAFGHRFALVMALLMIFSMVVSAATVALGFAGYFIAIVGIDYLLAAMLIIGAMSMINYFGIKLSSRFNTIATFTEFLGLILIIVLGMSKWGSVDLMEMPHGFTGVVQAGALVFFAYMGFETIIKLREETKNPDKTIPRALLLSILITSVVYILVAISAVSILPYGKLAASSGPLADVAAAALGPAAFGLIAVIALFSTSNTILLSLVAVSRMMYGMAMQSFLPYALSKVHPRRRTPYIAVIIAFLLTVVFSLLGNIELVANLANVSLFVIFAFVNLAAIILRWTIKKRRPFRMPLNIGNFPVLSAFGFLTSVLMFAVAVVNVLT